MFESTWGGLLGSFGKLFNLCMCISYTCLCKKSMLSLDNGFPERVTPNSSLVLFRRFNSGSLISSVISFMHKLMCLNWMFFSMIHPCTSLPSACYTTCYSMLSRIGTGSSGFLEVFSFLFFSIVWSRALSLARWASTWSEGKGILPI